LGTVLEDGELLSPQAGFGRGGRLSTKSDNGFVTLYKPQISNRHRSLPQASQEDQQVASPVLPNTPEDQGKTFFIFCAQLTFGLPPKTTVHVPSLFREWLVNSVKYISDLSLLPFEDVKGQHVTSAEQAPDESPSFYDTYYHKHRVLRHGNLTGMLHFSCSIS
jgi:hypothetical protein